MMSCGIEVLRGFEKLVIDWGGCLLGERLDRHLWIGDVLLRQLSMREIHRASHGASMKMKTGHEALAVGGHRMIWSPHASDSTVKTRVRCFYRGNDCILEPLDCGLAVETVRFSAVLR